MSTGRPLRAVWAAHGYVSEVCNPVPVRYRKALSELEGDDVRRLAGRLGLAPARTMAGEYIVVDVLLARPKAAALDHPVTALTAGLDAVWE